MSGIFIPEFKHFEKSECFYYTHFEEVNVCIDLNLRRWSKYFDLSHVAKQQLELAVGTELQKRSLPAEFAKYLTVDISEDSNVNIEVFERFLMRRF